MKKLVFVFVFASLSTLTYAQSSNPFTDARWQGRINYKDTSGITHNDRYDLILVPNGTCIVKITGKQNGVEAFQEADGRWSFNETFFRLECDFPDPVFEHLPALNWVSGYQFDALKTRFTLLVKPYPDWPGPGTSKKVSFNKVDD
ncbi:hypothetical protein AGMMS49944_27230 [Spirochaetia bacterium]|nr:hypothetical protein AGMMS49944_27230 [Spirochaetia bacterium]